MKKKKDFHDLVCCKCKEKPLIPCFITRSTFFGLIVKRYCIACYNKLKYTSFKLKIKKVIIRGSE